MKLKSLIVKLKIFNGDHIYEITLKVFLFGHWMKTKFHLSMDLTKFLLKIKIDLILSNRLSVKKITFWIKIRKFMKNQLLISKDSFNFYKEINSRSKIIQHLWKHIISIRNLLCKNYKELDVNFNKNLLNLLFSC